MGHITVLIALACVQDLRWKLDKGAELTYAHRVEQSAESAGEKSTLVVEYTERLTVERVSVEGHAVVKHAIVSLRVTVDGVKLPDSPKPREQRLRVTARGTIVERTSTSDSDDLLDRPPLALCLATLPEDATATSWSVEETDAGLVSTTRYKVESGPQTARVIVGETTVRLAGASDDLKSADGRGRQRLVFDSERGVVRESELESRTEAEARGEKKGVTKVRITSRLLDK